MNGFARIIYAKISDSTMRWSNRTFSFGHWVYNRIAGLGYRLLAVSKHFHTLASKTKGNAGK